MADIAASLARQPNMDPGLESDMEAYFGRLGKARELSQRAADTALREGEKETAAEITADVALREALYGNSAAARRDASAALHLFVGGNAQPKAALALALVGDLAKAENLMNDLAGRYPDDTVKSNLTLPEIRAAIEFVRGRPQSAVDQLATSAACELSCAPPKLMPAYLRGQAYLALHRGVEAVAEFQKILDHRGVVLNEPIASLAHLGLGRAYGLEASAAQTDEAGSFRAKARGAYQDFLTLWKDADPDVPILQQAKAEYQKLK
jgi:tetratricopeptide (TPR) repeat protein